MHKKLATQISIFLISILSFLVLFSCSESPDNEPDSVPDNLKVQLYKTFLGTYTSGTETIVVSANSVSYNRESFSLDNLKFFEEFSSDDYPAQKILYRECERIPSLKYIYKNTEYPDLGELNKVLPVGGKYEYIEEEQTAIDSVFKHKKNNELFLKISDSEFLYFNNSGSEKLIQAESYGNKDIDLYKWTVIYDAQDNGMYLDTMTERERTEKAVYKTESVITCDVTDFCFKKQENSSGPGESSGTESIVLAGSYTISEANGSTFTFAQDGKWTYNYNSRTTEGTWSVSDGKITITYSLGGYSSTAVFTVTVSGSTYKLTGKSDDYTTIISSAFMITNQEALENGVVTLVKK